MPQRDRVSLDSFRNPHLHPSKPADFLGLQIRSGAHVRQSNDQYAIGYVDAGGKYSMRVQNYWDRTLHGPASWDWKGEKTEGDELVKRVT